MMPVVNVHEAKTNLSRLLVQVEAGEDIIIARSGTPVARLVRFQKPGKRQFGSMKGLVKLDDSFFDPLPEKELAAWEGS
jgi:prevent-host-death family protein